MSITEAEAIKAVEDGLAGRNVPIVHEEIRVVLAMALERDALRARVETSERERADLSRTLEYRDDSRKHLKERAERAEADAARLREALEVTVQQGDIAGAYSENEVFMLRHYMRVAWLAAKAALVSAPNAEPEGPDYSGLCSAPECGGHCGYVHAVGCEAIREYLAEHGGAPYKAPARTAHLAPGAEPTPRDMRVAEAVREACFGISRFGRDGVMQSIRAIDLAAVVAKVVGT